MNETLQSENYSSYTDFFEAINQYLKKNKNQRALIQFQDFEQFSCSMCGACCERPWAIAITQEYYEKYYQFFNSHPSGRFKEPFIKVKANPKFYADFRRKEGSHQCIFLEADKTCFIHRHYGEDFLMPVCRQYPRLDGFKARQVEFRSLQASCKSVPQLWWENLHLSCCFQPLKQSRKRISFTSSQQTIDVFGYHYWIGFAMDYLNRSQPLINNFEALMQMLEKISEHTTFLAETELKEILTNFQPQEFKPEKPGRDILYYFAQDSQQDELLEKLQDNQSLVSDLTQNEESIRRYLLHKIPLNSYGRIKRGFALKDTYLILAFQWALIRVLKGKLTIDEAVNLVESLPASIGEFLSLRMTGIPFMALIQLLLSIR